MKKTISENYSVKIEADIKPYTWRDHGRERVAEAERKRCELIIEDIKRHVDNVERVELMCETKDICILCDGDYDEYEDGRPSCCVEAEDEWVKNKKAKELTNVEVHNK